MKKVLIDLVGQRFGRLVVVARTANDKGNHARWYCVCDCGGNTTTASWQLRSGKTSSCGCLHKEVVANLMRTHGGSPRGDRLPEYEVWYAMLRRCRDPRLKGYPRYGGRGIRVCERWGSMHLTKRLIMTHRKNRQGGAHRKITSAMIEAGVIALRKYEHFFSLGPTSEELLVRDVLRAAFAHERAKSPEMLSSDPEVRQRHECEQ